MIKNKSFVFLCLAAIALPIIGCDEAEPISGKGFLQRNPTSIPALAQTQNNQSTGSIVGIDTNPTYPFYRQVGSNCIEYSGDDGQGGFVTSITNVENCK